MKNGDKIKNSSIMNLRGMNMKKHDLFEVLLKQQEDVPLSDEENAYLDTFEEGAKISVLLMLNSDSYRKEKEELCQKIKNEVIESEKSVIK